MSGKIEIFQGNSMEYIPFSPLKSRKSSLDKEIVMNRDQINGLESLKLKNQIISLSGLFFSFLFMILAITFYEGPHIWHFLSFLGGIKETSTAARTFFGFSLLTLGVTMRYFFKGMKDVSNIIRENPIINLFGEFAGIGFIGIAIFELHTQGIIHNLSTLTAGICFGGSVLFYSLQLWKANNYSKKMISLLIIGGILIPFICISGIWIAENIFMLPAEILAIMQKAGFLSLIISIWIQDIYILRYHKYIREKTTRLNVIESFEEFEGEYKLIGNKPNRLWRENETINNNKLIPPLTIQISN